MSHVSWSQGIATDHLRKLAVLHHHGVYDSKESLIAREERSSSSKCVPLQHALAGMLGQYLNDAPVLTTGSNIPLEITSSDIEYRV